MVFFKRDYLYILAVSSALLLSFLLQEADSYSPPIKVVSLADKKRVVIGEKIRYITRVYTRPDVIIEFQDTEPNLGIFEVKDSGTEEKIGFGKKTASKWYILTAYETGEQTIPELTVRYRRLGGGWESISTNKVPIKVASIFERAKTGVDIKGIEPPISFTWAYKFHIIAGSILLALIGYGLFIFIKRRNQMLEEIRRGPPKDELIYQELLKVSDTLQAQASDTSGVNKDEFINIAQLMREYLEYRFKLKTKGMTTEEFLTRVKNVSGLAERNQEPLSSLLRRSDLVKFANHTPGKEELNEHLLVLKGLLNDIKPEGYY